MSKVAGQIESSKQFVAQCKVVDSERGKIVFNEPVGEAKKIKMMTDSRGKGKDGSKDYIAVLVQQGQALHMKNLFEVDRENQFAIILQTISPDRVNDAFDAIMALAKSGIVANMSVKDETKLYDDLTGFSQLSNDVASNGALLLKGFQQYNALQAQSELSSNRIQSRIVTTDAPKLEKAFDLTPNINGANIEASRPASISASKMRQGFYVPKAVRALVAMAEKVMSKGHIMNFTLTGASGAGKTEFFIQLAQHLSEVLGFEVNIEIVDCAVVSDPNKWFYHNEFRDGETHVELTNLAKAMKKGNCVILFDELNRVDPFSTNTLLPILDGRRKITVHGTEEIKLGAGIIIGSTMNIGNQYVGTEPMLDQALANRFQMTAEMPLLSSTEELSILEERFPDIPKDILKRTLRILDEYRQKLNEAKINTVDATIRRALNIVNLYAEGYDETTKTPMLTLEEAFQFGFVNTITDNADARKLLIEVIRTQTS